MVAEGRLHHLTLVLAQQAVIDEDARELIADRLAEQGSDDRRVNAAGHRHQFPQGTRDRVAHPL